jgi:4-aminobutyrate aminotransferase/(S)-3-amino-2-methylpropionate transaminase
MAMALTSKMKPYKLGMGPFPGETYKIPSPYCYRCPYGCTYPECDLACAEKFRTLLKAEMCPEAIAAVIAEPVQGEGGFIVPPKDYFTVLHAICKENDILLIADEVQAGFSRTGKMFASENFMIEPDLIALSKSIAAGVPLSAVVGRAEVMDGVEKGNIGGTYGGSPLACVASMKVIEKMQKLNLPERANIIGKKILSKGLEFKEKYSSIGDVRGIGAMIGFEFVKDRQTKEPDENAIDYIINYCFQKGILLISAGLFHNVIRFLPPLVITDGQLDYVLNTLDEAIGLYEKSK